MIHPHFNLQFVEFLAGHRTPVFTHLFSFAGAFGSAPFYALLTIFLYVTWDKHHAIRLSALAATVDRPRQESIHAPPWVDSGSAPGIGGRPAKAGNRRHFAH